MHRSRDRLGGSRNRRKVGVDDVVYISLTEMAEGVRAKKLSPIELVDAHVARITRLNPKVNAFVTVDEKRARKQAKFAEAALSSNAKSNSLGPLYGVPISIKSSIDVAGLPCECGSILRKGNVPTEDAPLVKRLRAAGAIILGNTNVPEFLMAYETDNLLYGRTNNPWDLARTPGGSSGGEAAAIAAGCSAGGGGGDGGGLISGAAHFSGVFGIEPAPGRGGERRRRFDTRAGAFFGDLRIEADPRARAFDGTLSCVGRTVFAVGSGGADGANGGGCGAIICGDGWAGHWGSGFGAGASASVERRGDSEVARGLFRG